MVAKVILFPVILALAIAGVVADPKNKQLKVLDYEGNPIEDQLDYEFEKTTLGELKSIIAEYKKIPVEDIRLVAPSSPLLKDDQLLSEYLNAEDQALFMLMRDLTHEGSINVVSMAEHTRLEVWVIKSMTVAELKKKLRDGVDPKNVRLFFNGLELEDNDKTLGDYQLYEGSYLGFGEINDKFYNSVWMANGTKIDIYLGIDQTVGDLIRLVKNEVDSEADLRLFYRDVIMEEDKLVRSYNDRFYRGMYITEGGQPRVKGFKINLYYFKKNGTSEQLGVFVKSSNTLGELKGFASALENIPEDKIFLKFNGKKMGDDSRKLSDFHLTEVSWITVREID